MTEKIGLVIYVPFAILAYLTINGMNHGPIWLIVITLLLLMPSIDLKYRPRNSVMVIPLVGYFLGKGFPHIPYLVVQICVLGLLAGFLWWNRAFFPFIKSKPVGAITSRILDKLPEDGVIVEGLVAYPIALNSKKRVVVMTHTPVTIQAIRETNLAIQHFDLHYAVFSERWILDFDDGYPVIDIVKKHQLLRTVKEDNDTYYIYNIRSNDTREVPTNIPS